MWWDATSACLKEQAGQRRSHPKECYPRLFLPQHMVRLVPGQGWQRSQWQKRCWIIPPLSLSLSLSLSPIPGAQALAPGPSCCCEGQHWGGKALPQRPISGCHLSASDQSHARTCVSDQSGASTQPGCPWGQVAGWGALSRGWRHFGAQGLVWGEPARVCFFQFGLPTLFQPMLKEV